MKTFSQSIKVLALATTAMVCSNTINAKGLCNEFQMGTTVVDTTTIYEVVEVNAEFPGGERACYEWLSQNVRYPVEALQQGIQGRVMVQFVVDKDGSLTEIQATRSPSEFLSREAERVVSQMPKWKPAMQGGKPVRSRFNLPIMFRLVKEEPSSSNP